MPTAKLEAFYRRVRPGGFWSVLPQEVRSLPGRALSLRTVADFVAGIGLTFGISLGIGHVLLQRYAVAAACFLSAAIGGTWVYLWFKREVQVIEETE